MPESAFPQRLRDLRNARGLSQPELAKQASIGRSSITNWEAGDSEPVASGIRRLAEFFHVTADYLLGLAAHPAALRAGDWLVDDEQVERVEAGTDEPGHYWAVPIPSRWRIVDSSELARIRARVDAAQKRPRRSKR